MPGAISRAALLGSALAVALGAAVPAWEHGVMERVSVGLGGIQGNNSSAEPSISADGRFIAFSSYATNLLPSDTNGVSNVFVRTLVP